MASFGLSFNPSDKDLIEVYLYNKVKGQALPNDLISECDLYGEENPWDIWNIYSEKVFVSKEGEDIYFFTRLKKKRPNAKKFVRKIGCGRWEGEGKTNILANNGQSIGIIRRFRFEKCQGMHDGAWIMHEYSGNSNLGFPSDYVVCRIRKNPRIFKKYNDQIHIVGQKRVENTNSEQMQIRTNSNITWYSELQPSVNSLELQMQVEPTNSQQIQTENMNSEIMMTELQPLPQTLEDIQQIWLSDFEKWELEQQNENIYSEEKQVDNIGNNTESKEQQMWPLDYEKCLLDGSIYSEEKLVDNTENNIKSKEDYKEFFEQECVGNDQIHTVEQMRVENINSEQMQIRNNPMSSKRRKISNITLCSEWQPYVNSLEQMLVESTNSQQIQTENMNSEQMMTELQPLPEILEQTQEKWLLFYEKELLEEEDENIYSEEKQVDNIRNNPESKEQQRWLLDYEKCLVDENIYSEEKLVDNTENNTESKEDYIKFCEQKYATNEEAELQPLPQSLEQTQEMWLSDFEKQLVEEQDENIYSEEKQVDNTKNNTESKEDYMKFFEKECATNEEVQKTWNDIQGYVPYSDEFIIY